MKKIFLLLLLILLTSCSLLEDESTHTFPAGIDSLSIGEIELRTTDFSTHIICGSMCWNGYYFEKTENGNNIYLRLFVTSDGNPCPAVCVERSFPYKFRALSPGNYSFHFWRNDSTNIDTTITIN